MINLWGLKGLWFLMLSVICLLQDDCMKPGDKLLSVNGESVLGYSVEKVRFVKSLWMKFECKWDFWEIIIGIKLDKKSKKKSDG